MKDTIIAKLHVIATHSSMHSTLTYYIEGQEFVENLVDCTVMAAFPASVFFFYDKIMFFSMAEQIPTQFSVEEIKFSFVQ